jgi:hypothetical protein
VRGKDSCRDGDGRVALGSVTGGEHPDPCGELRRHIDDGLAVVDQPVRDVLADAVAALDRVIRSGYSRPAASISP